VRPSRPPSERRLRAQRRATRAARRGSSAANAAALALCVALIGGLALLVLGGSAPARAQEDVPGDAPVQLVVTIVPPNGTTSPTPSGDVVISLDGRELLSIPLPSELSFVTTLTPELTGVASLLGLQLTVSYSGDSNYEASDGVAIIVPTSNIVTIVARPRDRSAPVVDVVSPAANARYRLGELVLADYHCRDPFGRSAVTRCAGPVATGSALDTSTVGQHSFVVHTADAAGNEATQAVTYAVAERAAPPPPPPPPPPGDRGALIPPPEPGPEPPSPLPVPPAAGAAAAPDVPAPRRVTPRFDVGSPASGPRAGTRREPATPPAATRATPPAARAAPPAGADAARAEDRAPASYDARSEPVKTTGILIAAFTLLQLGMGGGGVAFARGGGGEGAGAGARGDAGSARTEGRHGPSSSGFDPESVEVEFLGAGLGALAVGDRSRTWGWPGTRRLDAVGATLPARISQGSPLLARVLADGTYLRAIFGSASLLLVLAGVALGVLAVHDTGGDALPPVLALTIAIAVLGVLDAAAGLVAVLSFAIGVVALGGVRSDAQLRLMLGLGALWFVVPVLVGAVRPLRRRPARDLAESWDRAADFVIASLIGAWIVQKIVLALPGLAGVRLPIADRADLVAVCVLGALVVRLGFETIAAYLYPRRLDLTETRDVRRPGALQRAAASLVRMAVFVFVARAIVADTWQLWAAAALFVAPQILAVGEERLPSSPKLYRALPKGFVEFVFMLFVATAIGAILISTMNEHDEAFLATSLLLLSVPGCLLSVLQLFAREGPAPALGWGKRVAGVGLLALAIPGAVGLLL
jgi:hypothetical protein